MDFTSDFKELVRSRTDLVQLIGESVALTPVRGGAEYQSLCPFHDDHNPSMKVYPDRQSFRCWVCNEGGDAFTWVMKREMVSFPEAVKQLAERAHLELPKDAAGFDAEAARKSDLYAALKWAELQLHEFLVHSPEARPGLDYLHRRGYTDDTIARFRLGYHPDDWEWLLRRGRGQFAVETLVQAGIVAPRKDGSGFRDHMLFVDRVVFPIRDERARTVAFGGRVIPGREKGDLGKYINSNETPVFHKSRILFGFAEAREAIRAAQAVLVVEGYADCIACHQAGVSNVVATLGTAMTEHHVGRLKVFAPRIVMAYDGDEAGLRAAAKSVGLLLGQSADLRVLTLPDQQDPDEYLAAHGTDAFQKLVSDAPEAWEFRLSYEVARLGTGSVNAREQVLNEMLNLLRHVPGLAGSAREDMILSRLAARLQVNEAGLRHQLQKLRTGPQPPRPVRSDNPEQASPRRVIDIPGRTLSKGELLEIELIEMLFVRPELAERARQETGVDDFANPHLQAVVQLIYDVLEIGELPVFERVLLQTEDPALKSLCIWIADRAGNQRMEQKLHSDITDGLPTLFVEVLRQMNWRREEQSHRDFVSRQALTGRGADAVDRLRRAAEFHSKRIVNQPPGSQEPPRSGR